MNKGKHTLFGSVSRASLRPPLVAPQRQELSLVPSQFQLGSTLAKGERGGVIGSATKLLPESDGAVMSFRNVNEGEVKIALLFVDKLDKPSTNLMKVKDDSEDVTGLGLATQSRAIFDSGIDPRQYAGFVWETFKELEKREPGRWSLWQQYDTPIIPIANLSPDLAFQINLANGLIVPSPLTPYEDVLDFKERHRDELIALRHHLEELAIKLSKEGDARAVNLEIERFDASLSEYLKKARKSNVRKAVASLTTEFDWTAAVRGASGGGGPVIVAEGLNIIAAAAAIGGGILAGLSVKSVAGLKKGPSPFRYIARIEKEYG